MVAHPGVRSVIDRWERLDVALLGIGGPAWSEATVGAEAMREIRTGGAVGEVLIAPFDAAGRFVAPSLRARAVAFDARALPRVPVVIGVAEGAGKVAPILGALRGGIVNTLVTDVGTAEAILDAAGAVAA